MVLTFTSASITNVSTQTAKLLCKLTVHRHQCCRCPTNSCTLSVHLCTACHHLDILLFKIRSSTELTCFGASHASIYAALPFCILKCSCSRRHLNMLMVVHFIYRQSILLIEQSQHQKYDRRLPAQIINNSLSNPICYFALLLQNSSD
jgi:hypothetical protein